MMMKCICCFCLAMAVSGASALAAVVSGTPQEVFLRSHPQQSSAPEGIVYQVPDDKLEPGKLYHDASQDKSRMVTRKRVVGTLGQLAGDGGMSDYSGYLEYDVTFNYSSTRESQGEGKLTWSHNKPPKTYVNEQRLKARAERLERAFAVDAYKYMRDRVSAHENQHVHDAKENPVWLYTVSKGVGSKRNLMDKSDRDMINQLNASLLADIEKQRETLIFLAEARAVCAEVRCAANQLNSLLSLRNEVIPEEQKKQYIPFLYEMLFMHKGEDRDKYEDRKSKATYGYMTQSLKSKRDIFKIAEENVLLGSLENVRIDGADTGRSYSHVYETNVPFEAYFDDSQNPTDAKMRQAVSAYQTNIEKMYKLIHAKLYEENICLESIDDTRQVTPTGSSTNRNIGMKNFYEWLVCVEDTLEALPEACAGATCKEAGEAAYFAALCYKNAKKDDKASAMAYRVMYLRGVVTPGMVGASLQDKEMRIKCSEKKADVVEKFVSLISNNFNNNTLTEYLACVLVEEFPVGCPLYRSEKYHAIRMYQANVPDSVDSHVTYKWNHYRQEIIKAIQEVYMKKAKAFRESAKKASAR